MKRKELILIVITVILVGVLIGGYIYDNNTALLERTNNIAIKEDENLEIVKVKKVGFMYARAAYEAKLRVKNNDWDYYILDIALNYGGTGQMLDYEQYKEFEASTLDGCTIKPNPREDSFIWIFGAHIKENSDENVFYVVTREDADSKAFVYIYYSRK